MFNNIVHSVQIIGQLDKVIYWSLYVKMFPTCYASNFGPLQYSALFCDDIIYTYDMI